MSKIQNWGTLIGADVKVYKQDGGEWFEGTLESVAGDVLTIKDKEDDSEIEVNHKRNTVEVL